MTWEAFWNCVRHVLPPDGANCGALVIVLLVVPAVPFFAEAGVLECMDMGDMDILSWFEVMEAMCCEWGKANEV
jgi:hypothetical protein